MRIPPPGRLVNVGSRNLHLFSQGSGGPVVVLEAGIAASSVSWSLVRSRIAEFTTVVSYDRAGFGWSDPHPNKTAHAAAEDLARLLDCACIAGSVVLVGHSFGGLISRIFQQLFPERVAGMVLVDPVVRDEWRDPAPTRLSMLSRGVMLSRRGALLARWGVVGFALRMLTGGSRTIPKLMARLSAGKGAGVADRLVGEIRKMPRDLWPAIAQHWSRPESFMAMADNLENLPLSVIQLNETGTLGDLPVAVLSARRAIPEHVRDASLSTCGEYLIVPDAGHWLQLDAPDAVVDAVRRVVSKVCAA